MSSRPRRRGMILFIALVVAFIMMMWAVAALARANFQSSAVRFSYRKSECYYLAKRAISRSLAQINANPGWIAAHTGRSNADTATTPDAACWVEVSGTESLLRCEAQVGPQRAELKVPLLKLESSDTHVLSISPSLNGGPDLIAWTSISTNGWHPLPPIPGQTRILATGSTASMDVFALTQSPTGTTTLWRYRSGQGWQQMPDFPSGVNLQTLSVGGEERLIGRGSDNTIMVLPLGTSLNWSQISAPPGTTLRNVEAHPTGLDYAYATATAGGAESIFVYDMARSAWSQLPMPTAEHYDASTGASTGAGGSPTNFDGGLTTDSNGTVYVASNQPGEASVIYQFDVATAGSTAGSWTALPPVPSLTFQSSNPTGFSTDLRNLNADDEGVLWVQSNDPSSGRFAIISIDP